MFWSCLRTFPKWPERLVQWLARVYAGFVPSSGKSPVVLDSILLCHPAFTPTDLEDVMWVRFFGLWNMNRKRWFIRVMFVKFEWFSRWHPVDAWVLTSTSFSSQRVSGWWGPSSVYLKLSRKGAATGCRTWRKYRLIPLYSIEEVSACSNHISVSLSPSFLCIGSIGENSLSMPLNGKPLLPFNGPLSASRRAWQAWRCPWEVSAELDGKHICHIANQKLWDGQNPCWRRNGKSSTCAETSTRDSRHALGVLRSTHLFWWLRCNWHFVCPANMTSRRSIKNPWISVFWIYQVQVWKFSHPFCRVRCGCFPTMVGKLIEPIEFCEMKCNL